MRTDHWSSGLVCGILILLFKNFGIIYALAYIQLLITLFALSIHDTGSSSKVYFVGGPDFEFYYFGGYSPVGYCNLFSTWIFTKDLTRFLQGLLDNGYYLFYDSTMKYLLPSLQFNNTDNIGSRAVITKQPLQVPQL